MSSSSSSSSPLVPKKKQKRRCGQEEQQRRRWLWSRCRGRRSTTPQQPQPPSPPPPQLFAPLSLPVSCRIALPSVADFWPVFDSCSATSARQMNTWSVRRAPWSRRNAAAAAVAIHGCDGRGGPRRRRRRRRHFSGHTRTPTSTPKSLSQALINLSHDEGFGIILCWIFQFRQIPMKFQHCLVLTSLVTIFFRVPR